MTEYNEYEDKEYISARDKLIPFAARYADKQHETDPDKKKWDRTFILKMDRLAVDAGIQDGYLHQQSWAAVREERKFNDKLYV